jgi:ABC-type lipoprotein export system ATPase subunit
VALPAPSVLEVRNVVCQRESVTLRAEYAAFARGAFHLIVGEADSGHELLLRVLGLLEVPESGEVLVEGEPVGGLSEDARLKLRERRLGFVFTAPFLLPALSVIENVAMPLFKISDVEPPEARRRSDALLEFTGMLELAEVPCSELAPLAQHRASLARALVNEPCALLIETLDSALGGEDLRTFSALLRQAATRFDIAVIATASPSFSREPGDRIIEVANGVAAMGDKLLPELEP